MVSVDARLREENETLREEVRQLRNALAPRGVRLPDGLHLTPMEYEFFAHLSSRQLATHESLALLATASMSDHTVVVYIYRLRRKLKAYGVTIANVWGVGYRLDGWNGAKS